MDVLPDHFRTLHYLGFWKEGLKKENILRTMLRIITIILLSYMSITEIIELFRMDAEELIPNLLIAMCFLALMMKLLNFLLRRSDLIKLLTRFRLNACKPKVMAEAEIVNKYARSAAQLHKYFIILAFFGSASVSLIPILKYFKTLEIELPIKAYQAYDTSHPLIFWSTYIMQGVLEVYAAVVNGCFDTITYGFLYIATGQFQLCCYRLRKHIDDGTFSHSRTKREWIAHHILAVGIISDIQQIFMGVVVPFFFTNMLVLCAIIFKLYMESHSSIVFVMHVIYYQLILLEAYFYCWSGNELITKYNEVASTAYNSDWTNLQIRDKKCLLSIMLIGQQKITISLKGQCGLSMETFTWIIRTSYGVFNVLRGGSRRIDN